MLGGWISGLPRKDLKVLDTVLRVNTPENVAFEYQLAGPFRRGIAYAIDILVSIVGFCLLALAFILLISFIVRPLAGYIGLAGLVDAFYLTMLGMILVMYFIVYWFYGAFMETLYNGQTIGKRMTQMRVLTTEGHSIDAVQATLRNFFRLLDICPFVPLAVFFTIEDPDTYRIATAIKFPTCFFALIVMASNRRFQRIGDWVAGTVVVNQTTVYRPSLISFGDPRVPSLAEMIPAQFVPTPSLVKAVAHYADRRSTLHPQRAREIGAHVAQPLIDQFGLLPDTDYDLFLCALYYRIFITEMSEESLDTPSVIMPSHADRSEPIVVVEEEVRS